MMDLPPSATSVPSISVLRQRLDYGDPVQGRVKAFILDLRIFTQRYITSLDIRGSEIIDWGNSEALREVANAWLETENRGITYWPHNPHHANFNKYQYLTDEQYIKSILMQLIFRANKNANQNQKYKAPHRKQRHSHSSFPTTTSWQCDTTAPLYSPNGSVMQPPHEFTPIIDTTDRYHLNDGNRQTPIDPDLVPTPQEQREEEVVVLPLPTRPHAQTEVLSQNTTPTSTTAQESPPATSDGIEPEQMQRHQEAPTVTTQPVVHIVDANEEILGHLGNIRTHDKRLKHIQSLPIQRKVRIRPGRTFTKKHFTSIHYERDPKRFKWVSCMIQAVGTVQRQRCSNCQRNRGAFAECVIVGGPMFPKCGNCEWNHHGCYISTENGHDPPGSSRVEHAQTLPIYIMPEDHVVEAPNGTSRHDQQPIRMEVDDIDLLSKTHQTCASDHISINCHQEPRVEIQHQDSVSQNERHETPTTKSNSQHKEKPNAQGRSGNQAITILYKLVYSRTPSFKAVYWTPKGVIWKQKSR